MRFKDKVVIVTGAAAGIGLRTAQLFAAEGAIVAINDLHEAAVASTVAAIESAGGRAMAIEGDAADFESVEANVAKVMQRYGRIDVLVNNAGIISMEPARAVSAASWKKVMTVNVDSVFWWSQTVANASMIQNRQGAIVNVASLAGLAASPHAAAYVTSKHAVIGLTKALSTEWGQYNIRVNAVCPGLTMTDMLSSAREKHPTMVEERERRIPLGRSAQTDDQANAILFLASAQAGSIHGIVLPVDGGQAAMSSGASVQRDPV